MTIEAVKSAPPVTVVSLALGGVSLQDWVFILTLLWLLLQIGWFAYSKFIRPKASGDE